jgi:hypothetical protein
MSYLGDKFDMNGTTEAQKIRTQEGYKHSTTGHQRTAQTDLLFVLFFFFCGVRGVATVWCVYIYISYFAFGLSMNINYMLITYVYFWGKLSRSVGS